MKVIQMATTPALRELRNFVNGEFTEASPTARRWTSSTRRPGGVRDRAALRTGGRRRAMQRRRTRSRTAGATRRRASAWRYLLQMADAIEETRSEMVAIERENTGKPKGLTLSEEIPPMVDQIRFFAGAARLLEGRSAGEYMRGFTSSIRREPIGVIGSVAPWNYPMMMAVWKFAPALAAGNTIVLKPSDTTPASAV